MECKKILVVDDDRTTAKIIELQLSRMGYSVPSIATTGSEAIDKARTFSPDLMLMDIKLGRGIDGIEAARIIKQKYQVPVIYLTAHSDESTLSRALDTEPLGYVNKPLREKDLRTTISLALTKMDTDRGSETDTPVRDESWKIRANFSADGKVIRISQGTRKILQQLGVENIKRLLPESHEELVQGSLQSRESQLMYSEFSGHLYSCEYVPSSDRRSVTLIISDKANINRIDESNGLFHANLMETLDHLTAGIILINENLNIFYSNESAKRLIKDKDGLCNYNGYLVSHNPAITSKIRKLILDKEDNLLSIERENDQNNLNIFVTSLEAYSTNFGKNLPTSILFAFEKMDNSERVQEVLRGLYRLSPTEARLVSQLFITPDLSTAAEELGITLNTARTHMKRIYNKTNVHRVSALIHMIVTGPASVILNTNG